MPILKIERAQVVITPEGKELHLLTCAACNRQFYGKANQQRCDTCGKAKHRNLWSIYFNHRPVSLALSSSINTLRGKNSGSREYVAKISFLPL
jgi:hypothetical protein